MHNDVAGIGLLRDAFEVFLAKTLASAGPITDSSADPDDADTIENEFAGRTWHNLIYYHYRWAGSLLLRWSLTDAAYVEVLPSFLCACVLWPAVDSINIAADLLAPIDTKFVRDWKTSRFQYLNTNLSGRHRAVSRIS